MKVETPQILWNSEGDKGINAALHSISMLESGLDHNHHRSNDHQHTSTGVPTATAVGSSTSSSSTQQQHNLRKYGTVMVTAGNTPIVNLWKLSFPSTTTSTTGSSMFLKQQGGPVGAGTKIDYLCSLTRQEVSVNTVAFSPDGLHLATGGESGKIVVWSVPPSMRGNGNGRHFWSSLEREQDLSVKIISSSHQGICDISWSADSKRFIAGTIDHSVFVCEDINYDSNNNHNNTNHQQQHQLQHKNNAGGMNGESAGPTATTTTTTAAAAAAVESQWKIVFQNSMDHTQYVQGVAYDPLGVYLATMGSDRSVRVFPRKTPPKSKKKVLRPANNSSTTGSSSTFAAADCFPPPEHQRMVGQLLTDSKFEVSKSKLIKFRQRTSPAAITAQQQQQQHESENNNNNNNNNHNNNTPKPPRSHLYVDESTLESFFRRLSWTSDGAYLVTPAALWHSEDSSSSSSSPMEISNGISPPPTFATYLFARHKFDEPCKVLAGLDKPSLVVRPSPVLFKLPGSGGDTAAVAASASPSDTDCKENESPLARRRGLPYRSVFAVLTLDSVLVYDTHHTRPLSIIQGLHYASMSDCQWSADGMNLVVSSTDGYISIVTFDRGELGEVYGPAAAIATTTAAAGGSATTSANPQRSLSPPVLGQNTIASSSTNKLISSNNLVPKSVIDPPRIPPCEPGQMATLEAPPSKRSKKTRIAPTLISAPGLAGVNKPTATRTTADKNNNSNSPTTTDSTAVTTHVKRPAEDLWCLEKETNNVGEAVTKLTLNTTTTTAEGEKPKKKKRIQPVLVNISPATH